MDFFDKLSKKTSEAYQTAKEKTTKLSGEIKLKSKITECEEKIYNEFSEIGKIVYEKMKVGEDASKDEIIPKCEEVDKLKEEIERAKVEILALKDIKKCVNCGAELEMKSEFCSKCGTKQPVVAEPEVIVEEEPVVEAEVAQDAEVTEVSNVEEENND